MASEKNAIQYANHRQDHAFAAYESKQKAADLAMQIKLKEQSIMTEVANAVGEDGKPMFSNADKRNAEIAQRCLIDPELAELKIDQRNAEDEAAARSITAQYYADLLHIELAFAKENPA